MRKSTCLLAAFLIFIGTVNAQAVGLNEDGSAPDAKAILDLKSTSKGLLIPRLTLRQRIDMTGGPAQAQVPNGLLIYQTDENPGFYYFQDGGWQSLRFTFNHVLTQNLNTNGKWISGDGTNTGLFLSNAKSVGINEDGSVPDLSAVVDIKSTSKGLLIPRMTQAEKNLISSPINGLLIYQIDVDPGFYYYQEGWQSLKTTFNHILNQNLNTNGKWLSSTGSDEGILLSPNSISMYGILINKHHPADFSILSETGSGSKLIWYPKKSSFRAGYVDGSTWDDINIGESSIAMGRNTMASFKGATAMGYNTIAGDEYATAMGWNTKASGQGAVAMGLSTIASSSGAFAMGQGTNASQAFSTAMGFNTTASGQYSTAMGINTKAGNSGSTALGTSTTASGPGAIAIGYNTSASGTYSTAMGNTTTASGQNATAMGQGTNASGLVSTAMGFNTIANNENSTAMGRTTTASGKVSTAIGQNNLASGDYSTAMGINTVASGLASIAMGTANNASGIYSIATGQNTTASGFASIAMGIATTASGSFSTATGVGTTASGNSSTAMGSYVTTNLQSGSFIIGDANNVNPYTSNDLINQMVMRFSGGYKFFTNAGVNIGVQVSPGGNSWTTISDINRKENFAPVDGEEFLIKISRFQSVSWNYRGQDAKQNRHYGPMAQEFYAAFGKDGYGTIGDDTTINQADFDGVNLIAIQALEKRTTELKKGNEDLKKEVFDLKQTTERLQAVNTAQNEDIKKLKAQLAELAKVVKARSTHQ